jgi:hypothetical protein
MIPLLKDCRIPLSICMRVDRALYSSYGPFIGNRIYLIVQFSSYTP